jgi:hypothetical protein
MAKLIPALQSQLSDGEQILQTFEGLSDGLNRTSRQPVAAALGVTDHGVAVAWTKVGLVPKAVADRFAWSEIIDVVETDDRLPGMVGAMERKNATKVLGRAMGASDTRPAVTLRTRRGDFCLYFKPKERGLVRAAFVAISDGLRASQ